MPRGQMRIALHFKQVQSRSRAACSTGAIHAHLLLTAPTSLMSSADGIPIRDQGLPVRGDGPVDGL
jgi:hypothetical protein